MNQQTTNCETQESDETSPGEVIREMTAGELLRAEFGIPQQGLHWLLYQAPYRPTVARYVEVDHWSGNGTTYQHGDGWLREGVFEAARAFMSECKRETPGLWSHRKVAGRFKLRPPAGHVSTKPTTAEPASSRSRAGRTVPRINLRRISPDDLADAHGFADDWAAGTLDAESLSQDAVEKLAFLKYGLPRWAVTLILHSETYRPEPTEWRRPPRPRAPLMGVSWNPQDAHRAVLQFISECKPGARQLWSHPHVREKFKLRPPATT